MIGDTPWSIIGCPVDRQPSPCRQILPTHQFLMVRAKPTGQSLTLIGVGHLARIGRRESRPGHAVVRMHHDARLVVEDESREQAEQAILKDLRRAPGRFDLRIDRDDAAPVARGLFLVWHKRTSVRL